MPTPAVDIYRVWIYRSGIRDPAPSDGVSDKAWMVEALAASLPKIAVMYPDVTELAIEDQNGVQWFRVRIRLDNEDKGNELPEGPTTRA